MPADQGDRQVPFERERTGLPNEGDAAPSADSFRVLLELVSDCCWARWSTGGEVKRLWMNEAFEELTGYSAEEFEVIGREGLVHPEDLERVSKLIDGPLGRSDHEFRIVRKDGETRWLRETMNVSEEPNGSVFVLGATRDVTSEKRAERLLRDANLRLERKVRDRTYDLRSANRRLRAEIDGHLETGRRLEEALAEARLASQAKTRFLANMSHEIRTPIHGIMGLTDALGQFDLTEEARRLLGLMSTSTEALLELIDDLLDFSRIEAGELRCSSGPIDVQTLLSEVVGLAQARHRRSSHLARIDLHPDLPLHLEGDGGHLRQILVNLVDNAFKFCGGSPVTIRARHRKVGNGDEVVVRFEVRDSGPGIPKAIQPELFDPFTQVDDTPSRSHGGAGLGLAISRRLVETMGGTIGLESQPGEGATFWFEVPLRRSSPSPKKDRVGPGADDRPLLDRCVLVVEDNPVNRLVLERQLELVVREVATANDGLEALERLAEQSADLVLMDCHMPSMNGFDATLQLRRRGFSSPIVGVTASVSREELERCHRVGMNQVLTKPFRQEDLERVVLKWLAPEPAGYAVLLGPSKESPSGEADDGA